MNTLERGSDNGRCESGLPHASHGGKPEVHSLPIPQRSGKVSSTPPPRSTLAPKTVSGLLRESAAETLHLLQTGTTKFRFMFRLMSSLSLSLTSCLLEDIKRDYQDGRGKRMPAIPASGGMRLSPENRAVQNDRAWGCIPPLGKTEIGLRRVI